MEEVSNNSNNHPFSVLADSLFFEKDEESGKTRLSAFGGFVYIIACVSLFYTFCKIHVLNLRRYKK